MRRMLSDRWNCIALNREEADANGPARCPLDEPVSFLPAGGSNKGRIWPGLWINGSELVCNLWMIEPGSHPAVRCQCLESSPSGLRFLAPPGSHVRTGQRCLLCAQLPGERAVERADVIGNAWVTIADVRVVLGGDADDDHLEVRALRWPLDTALKCLDGERVKAPANARAYRAQAAGPKGETTNGFGTYPRW